MLSPNSCGKYFKLGTTTRRYSVIGCIGYENANPTLKNDVNVDGNDNDKITETVDIGVGTSDVDNNNDDNAVTCAICFECLNAGESGNCFQQKKNIATTECGHTFCLSCLLKQLHHSNDCPLCRAPIEQNVKKTLKPLSYSDGIGLLDHELNGLRILEEVEQFVQNAMEISSQPNTNGQNVEDVVGDIMNMVTNFGFNLLYDATLHTTGSEQQMDPEWIAQMYNNDDDVSDDDSAMNDNNSDSDSDSDETNSFIFEDEDESESESESDDRGSDFENKRIVLPEIPESML